MFDVTAMATTFSKLLEDGVDPSASPETRGTPGARISFVTAFYLATTGGGIALDLPIGLLKPGLSLRRAAGRYRRARYRPASLRS